MTKKHNNGPWTATKYVNDTNFLDYFPNRSGFYTVSDAEGTLVGVTLTDSDSSSTNASLIASAPLMLYALKLSYQKIHSTLYTMPAGETRINIVETLSILQSAIDNAEGK